MFTVAFTIGALLCLAGALVALLLLAPRTVPAAPEIAADSDVIVREPEPEALVA